MKPLRLRRPGAPMIIAVIALVAAIGGTAIAGGPPFLPKKKFQNFKPNVLKTPITYVTATQSVSSANVNATQIVATCAGGTHPTGGGVKVESPNFDTVVDQYPTAQSYVAHVFAGSSGPTVSHNITVIAACVTANTTAGTPPSS